MGFGHFAADLTWVAVVNFDLVVRTLFLVFGIVWIKSPASEYKSAPSIAPN